MRWSGPASPGAEQPLRRSKAKLHILNRRPASRSPRASSFRDGAERLLPGGSQRKQAGLLTATATRKYPAESLDAAQGGYRLAVHERRFHRVQPYQRYPIVLLTTTP